MSATARMTETAESVYLRQQVAIAAAIDKLQAVLDDMRAPGDPDAPIGWADVATNADVVDALHRAELA
jgi:hypothetical protein